jgi:hypothetical protein
MSRDTSDQSVAIDLVRLSEELRQLPDDVLNSLLASRESELSGVTLPDHINRLSKRLRQKFEPSEDWSIWFNAIRESKVKVLKKSDVWGDCSELIQVKHMSLEDLDGDADTDAENPDMYPIQGKVNSKDDLEMTARDTEEIDRLKDVYPCELYLDVIKLPKPIPDAEKGELASFLFIRPDEYCIIRCIPKQTRC